MSLAEWITTSEADEHCQRQRTASSSSPPHRRSLETEKHNLSGNRQRNGRTVGLPRSEDSLFPSRNMMAKSAQPAECSLANYGLLADSQCTAATDEVGLLL